MNFHAVRAIYMFEMARTFRTILQSIAAPVLSTSLYFIVFGSAIGSRMTQIEGIPYGAFIIPGLTMLSLLNESVSNAALTQATRPCASMTANATGAVRAQPSSAVGSTLGLGERSSGDMAWRESGRPVESTAGDAQRSGTCGARPRAAARMASCPIRMP